MEKNGMLTEKSQSDYDKTKKAEYYDLEGYSVADADNRHLLTKPEAIKELNLEEKNRKE